MPTVAALDYVQRREAPIPDTIGVAFGAEPFLRRLVVERWLEALGGEAGASRLEGKLATPAQLSDLLSTRSLFGGAASVALVEEADEFISPNRAWLEKYAASPRSSGVLLLVAATWPSNTRLYKAIDADHFQVDCGAPKPAAIGKWLTKWAASRHGLKLASDAAELLTASAGDSLGLLDQELAKLALVAADGHASSELVERYCGGWKAKTAWAMLDAALDGQAASALEQLDRLLAAGESPIGVLGQISVSLRRFHAATRYVEADQARGRRPNLSQALTAAGVKKFVLAQGERQLRRLGRQRAGALDRALLDADLALKGAGSAPARARIVLERLILSLAAPAPKPAAAARG